MAQGQATKIKEEEKVLLKRDGAFSPTRLSQASPTGLACAPPCAPPHLLTAGHVPRATNLLHPTLSAIDRGDHQWRAPRKQTANR